MDCIGLDKRQYEAKSTRDLPVAKQCSRKKDLNMSHSPVGLESKPMGVIEGSELSPLLMKIKLSFPG